MTTQNLDIREFLDQDQRKDLLRLLTAGSVDDGKSTLYPALPLAPKGENILFSSVPSGLFWSSAESKQNHSESGKLRGTGEITRPNLGFVKMKREEQNQP